MHSQKLRAKSWSFIIRLPNFALKTNSRIRVARSGYSKFRIPTYFPWKCMDFGRICRKNSQLSIFLSHKSENKKKKGQFIKYMDRKCRWGEGGKKLRKHEKKKGKRSKFSIKFHTPLWKGWNSIRILKNTSGNPAKDQITKNLFKIKTWVDHFFQSIFRYSIRYQIAEWNLAIRKFSLFAPCF